MKNFTSLKTLVLVVLFIVVNMLTSMVYGTHTLTNADVVVNSDGIITSCSYNYADKSIIIPQILDGYTVTGIADASPNSIYGVFYNKGITSVQLPSTIETIGTNAFRRNSITSLNFTGCTSLKSIAIFAFYGNQLSSVNFTGCTALISIVDVFRGNNSMTGFTLPTVTGHELLGWRDGSGTVYSGGDFATNLGGVYKVPIPYTLTDDDVVVTSGIIISCSYDFLLIDITIPQTLDGQTVIGIADASDYISGVFSQNGIYTLILPPTLQTIGDYAFYANNLDLNFSPFTSLQSIGKEAFYGNRITNLNLTGKLLLISIGDQAFNNNDIVNIDLSGCTSLTSIGVGAFYSNELASINLTGCSNLVSIKKDAFANNSSLSGFALPTNTTYPTFGWKDNDNNSYTGGETVTELRTAYRVPIPYTLTDEDVVVTDSIIESCSYDFTYRDIIVPATLDGQTVLGIANGASSSTGIFSKKEITSLQLPTTLQTIGDFAFNENFISSLDLSGFNSLTNIGERAFHNTQISNLSLNGCTALTTIGDYAFSYMELATVDLSSCTALSTIGNYAFRGNHLSGINLNSCTSLNSIGNYAFDDNSFSEFTLPINTVYTAYGWKDEYDNVYDGGDVVTDLETFYKVPIPYTLTDDDVIVTDGVIISCSYDFYFTDIIIPDTLDGQAVIGIVKNEDYDEVFADKGITSVQLPTTLEFIGYSAFYYNNLTSIDLTGLTVLDSIGNYAFESNSLDSLNLSNCTLLRTIGEYAFAANNLYSLDLSGCTALTFIGYEAFYDNSLTNVNFSGCTSLSYIDDDAFYGNNLTSVDLSGCTALTYIGTYAFSYNSLSGIILPTVTGYEQYGWRDDDFNTYTGGETVTEYDTYYEVPIPYTLTDDDVVVTGGIIMSCSYNFERTDIIIPDTLDGEEITGIVDGANSSAGVFYYKGITSIQLPSALDTIGKYAFYDNSLYELDLTTCTLLTSIGDYAFSRNKLASLDLTGCTKLIYIGLSSFADNPITNLDLSTCTALETIGDYAFSYSKVTNLDLTGCTALTSIGKYAFRSNNLTSLDLSSCTALTSIGDYAFAWNSLNSLDISGCTQLTSIRIRAFTGNAFSAGFILPTPEITGFLLDYWLAATGAQHAGGDTVTNTNTSYSAILILIPTNTVTFNVNNGITPIEGATINLDGYGNQITDIDGITIFTVATADSISYTASATNHITLTDSVSALDSAVIENVTMVSCLDSSLFTELVCEGEVISVGDSTYYETGTFVTILTNQHGCDSVVTLNLTVNPVDSVEITKVICEGEQVDIGSSTYSETGIFVTMLNNQYGCDSVVTLNLTVNPVDSVEITEVICEGEQVDVGGSTYLETGIFVTMLNNQYGCDSVVTLNLTVNPVDSVEITEVICEGEQVHIGDSTYTETGIFVTMLNNQFDCDSVVTLDLTVNPVHSTEITEIICEGEQIDVGSSTYTETGLFVTTLNNQYGCDSVVTLNLTVNPVDSVGITKVICEGEQIDVGSSTYSETGIFVTMLNNQYGCDSVVTLNLTVNPVDSVEITEVICEGEQVHIGDSTYTETGIFITMLNNQYGCDSVVTLDLTVNPVHSIEITKIICEGEQVHVGDSTYTETGIFVTMLNNQYGCDSLVALDLTVNPVHSIEITEMICEGEQISIGDSAHYSQTGVFTTTLQNRFGCDSTIVLDLEVLPKETTLNKIICEGESVIIGDSTYTKTGIYVDTLTNQLACDSIVTLNLTVLPEYTNLSQTICMGDTAFFADIFYTQTGVYTDSLHNQLGCDSIIVLDLIVNRTDSINFSEVICEGEAVLVGDSSYTQTGDYTNKLINIFGCDSIVSLKLIVNPTHQSEIDDEICEGDTYLFNGIEYERQGTYIDTFQNQYGCDSIEILNLIVHPSDRILIKDTINGGDTYTFQGESYTSTGLYADTLENKQGCDSILTLLLFVHYEPVVFIPDTNFKSSLLADTLINSNKDDEIQISEAEKYSGSIIADNKQIESLIGIEAFVNIDTLNCSGNELDSLDLSANTKLAQVNCAQNTLTYFNTSGLNNLSHLNCANNQLTILSPGTIETLQHFDCSDNNFVELDLSQNPNLLEFNCENNQLTQLDLRNGNNTNLSILSTGNTNLTCVSVDDIEYSNTNWTGLFDGGTIFSTDCNAPDIAVNNITFIPPLVSPGDTLHVNWDVINYGGADAIGGWDERVSLISGTGQQVYLNGNLKWSNTLLATDTIKRNASLEIPEITYFSGYAYVMIELIPNTQIEAMESIVTNNSLVSDDVLTLNEIISLHIPETSVSEDLGNSIRCYVKRSGNSDNILSVFLSASSNDLLMPDSVDIQTGSNAQAFDLIIIDNNLFDGNRSVEIVASTVNLNDTSATIEIIDDDVPDLAISINNDTVSEGVVLDVLISSNKTSDTTQVVGLSSNKNSQWNFPINASIPANQSSVSIQVEVTDDNAPELKAEAWLSVAAKGYHSASDTVLIIDDDFPEINLAILPDTVSESAGYNAVRGIITRMSDNDDVITISLSSTLSNEINMPEMVHFFPGEMEKQFDIDIIDNTIVDGFRTSEITAAVYIPSCSCNSDTENGEIATATLVIADDDGPSLRLACEPLILAEGTSNIATLTVSRNTSTESALFVHLTSNNPSEISLQDTVTIPAGELSVDVPVYAIDDSTDDGQQTVTIQASATNFSPGTINVFTSDQNKPDLTIPVFATNTNIATLKQQLELNATIYNSGLLNASSGLFVKLYLSTDTKLDSWDELIESYLLTEAIPLGDSISFWELATMPDKIGDYYLILVINPDEIVSELLYINNESEAIPITLISDFTLTAVVAEETFTSAQPVTITGTATMGNGSPASNKNIEVYIITQGIRRTVEATTDNNGNYSTVFEPGLNEVGHYLAGACSPGEGLTIAQDEFDIMGFATTLNDWLIWYVEKGSSITDTIEIKNFSNADLTNLTFNLLSVPPGLDLQINTIPTLSGNATAQFSYTITGTQVTEGFDYLQLPVEITSSQGVSFNFKVLYFCQAKEGLLKTEPVNLETSFTKGKIRYVEFYIYNVGAGNSGEINIVLPNVNWMSLASSSTIENIASGESSKVTLRLNAADDTELNFPMTGNIAINATNCDGIQLPYRIKCVSEETGGLIVDVVDEYTYSTAEAPHLANAQVQITNPYTGEIVGEGNTNANGLIEFTDIPEGIYELLVQAHQHDGYKKTIIINPGMVTQELVFISFQAISYIWTVVPTEIEDEYKIELVIEYETNVPKPVVELEMPGAMPDIASGETYSFIVTLTNHGLITAEDVDLSFPEDDPEYEFIFLDKKYEIPAKQSIQIPVTMQFKDQTKSAKINSLINTKNNNTEAIPPNCVEATAYEYGWQCGPNKKYEMYKRLYKYLRCKEKDDDDDGGNGGGDDDDNQFDPGEVIGFTGKTILFPPNIFGSGGGTGVPILDDIVSAISGDSGSSGYDPTSSDFACDPCKVEIAKLVVTNLPVLGSYFDWAINAGESIMENYNCFKKYRYLGEEEAFEKCLWESTKKYLKSKVDGHIPHIPTMEELLDYDEIKDELEAQGLYSPIKSVLGAVKTIDDITKVAATCYLNPPGIPIKSAKIENVKPDMLPTMQLAITDMLYVLAKVDAEKTWLDEFWAPIDWQNKINFDEFIIEVDSFVSGHIQFQATDIDLIKQHLLFTDLNEDDIDNFTARWNESIEAWDNGVFTPNAQFPNMIDEIIADQSIAKSDSVTIYVQSRGYMSIDELIKDAFATVQDEIDDNQNSVCASVKLSISQKLVMTREAFRGTLTIFNGNELSPMEEFELKLEIKNENGELCNDLFHIETESLEILTGIDGTGILSAQETGTATILFIPEKEAAPTITQSYSFGGTISYIDPFTKTEVTKDLFPVILEVHPSPDLYLHYFMQRDILGDDPLTENIVEPSIPGELALMIENNGFGDAQNILIESAQPEIIDNEKGLLIEFQLTGSNLQGQPVNMGLINIDFGTVAAQSTKVGQWWFTSSLLGHFVNYEANLTHVDSRGNPNLSLISGATLHELIRSISVYGALDDNIPDFLVNEVQDKDELPDAIYLSQGNTVLDVYEASLGSFDVPVSTPDFTNVLTLSPRLMGWNYLKLDDPGNGQFKIASVTRNNDGQEIPLSNAWLTNITMPDGEEHIYENKFHIVDDFEAMTSQSYTIVWTPKDSVPVEIVEIEGAPEQITTTPVSELVVIFNKQIDLSSFTFEDITIQHENGANLSDNSISITQIDAASYRINFSTLTSGDGLYSVTVQTDNINDLAGNSGLNGKMVSWVQALSVPAVEEFIGLPTAPTNQLFNSIQLRFNTEIDFSTLTPERFVLERNGTAISTSLFIYPADNSFTLFTIINIESAMIQDGDYTLWIDVSEIRSLTGLFGIDVQYAEWTIDNTPPELQAIIEIDEGKLDKQHVSKLQLDFSEPVSEPDHSTIELWKNNVPVDITQLEIQAISANSYIISNFGMSTYNEGEYSFIVKTNQLTDIAGNFGLINTTYLWTVDRTPPPAISNLAIIPDLGISNSDQITSKDSLAIIMTVNEDETNIKLFEVDGNNRVLVHELTNVNSGLLSIPAQFPNGGQVNTEIECSDSLGNTVVSTFGFYIDKTELYATISGAPILLAEKHPDSLKVEFSEEIVEADFTNNTLSVTHNGTPVSSSAITINAISNTVFILKGFDSLSLQNGQYNLSIDLTQISKLISGKFGGNTVSTNWDIEIPNAAPIANAGSDANVRQGQFYTFDASATIDPDGDSISYSWYAPAGIALLTPNSPSPSFIVPPDSVGTTYSFMLAVSDGKLTHTDKSIVNINKLLIEENISATICNGEEYKLGTQTLILTGIYTEIFRANDGTDSTVILNLTVNPVDSVDVTEVICEGEQVDVGDSTYTETGVFATTLINQFGCDSVVTLNLTVNPIDSVETTEVICEGEQIDVGDSTYNETGVFATTLINQFGCDSVVTLNLTVNPIDSVEITEVICEGEQVDVGDSIYTETGVFATTLTNQFGCDSVVILNLTVNPVNSVDLNRTICEGEVVRIGNSTYSETGVFATTLTNQFGCDSVVILNLTVNPVNSVELNKIICEGEVVSIGSSTYSETGIFATTLTNQFGCDSVVTLNLTVNPVNSVELNRTICEGEVVSIGSSTYSETGVFATTLINQFGCDSIVTLNLTVNAVNSVELNKTICEGEVVSIGSSTYSETGIFATTLTNQFGCDSVVTLNLTVNPVNSVELNKTICEGEVVSIGSSTYSETGIFATTLTNQFGCDSVVTLNLTVNAVDSVTLNDTISEGETYFLYGTVYTNSGTYVASIVNQFGCDSIIVTLNLTVIANNPPYLNTHHDNVEILVGDTLSVTIDLTDAFSDPDDPILNYDYKFEGDENPDWISFTLTDSLLLIKIIPLVADTGCYDITVKAVDNLGQQVSDTFELCVLNNITEIEDFPINTFNLILYPNPTKGEVTIDFSRIITEKTELMVIDLKGSQVFKQSYLGPTKEIVFDMSQQKSGIYLISINVGGRHLFKKLILE